MLFSVSFAFRVLYVFQMYIEFCEGGAIDSIMVDLEKSLTENQIRYVCNKMCRGLEFLHSNKVIHRDLKAGNVLLTGEGDVKLGKESWSYDTLKKRKERKRCRCRFRCWVKKFLAGRLMESKELLTGKLRIWGSQNRGQ